MQTFTDEISYADPTPDTRTRVYDATGIVVSHPTIARDVFKPMMLPDRETLAVMLLDSGRRVIAAGVVATGTVDSVICEPASIFRPALLVGATHVLIAHNHPNGDPTPSRPDIETTRLLEAGARILGIVFVDHLVLTAGERYQSIAEWMETRAL